MCKSCDALCALAGQSLDTDPLAGYLHGFAHRRATRIKALYFDCSGWCLWGKSLQAGTFGRNWFEMRDGEIDCKALKLMLEGIAVWFERQLRGKKGERCVPQTDPQQTHFGQLLGELAVPPQQPEVGTAVPAQASCFAGAAASVLCSAARPSPRAAT